MTAYSLILLAPLGAVAAGLAIDSTPETPAPAAPVTEKEDSPDETSDYDPLAFAKDSYYRTVNWEATVVPACYTKTDAVSNPCWVCHTVGVGPNDLVDFRLQEEYAFSDIALTNHWSHFFEDRSEEAAAIPDDEIVAWLKDDNYTPLKRALADLPADEYPGYRPDLEFDAGFDAEGFANDGSGWRALRYKPFSGTFWPTNGSTDDVFVRLPMKFRTLRGEPSREVEKANLSILEAMIAADPRVTVDSELVRETEPLDEALIGVDLDGDGEAKSVVTEIRGLPTHFVGDASDVEIERYVHPQGVEYLHSVRYVDLDVETGHSRRMKELRWSKKDLYLDAWARLRAYELEDDEKDKGIIPYFTGGPEIGLSNDFGWRLQGFIEDAQGRLRLQTDEEQRSCMGCHSAIGVTVDQTFTLARKVPGLDGWRYQDIRGIQDAPQAGHDKPEILTYLERVRGGDEFRANREMLERFFDADGNVFEDKVRVAQPGGPEDITALVLPSKRRALDLAKAYRVLVDRQRFDLGRDAIVGGPVVNMHAEIENGDTELAQEDLVFMDGRLWLDWNWRPEAEAAPIEASAPSVDEE